MNKNLITTLFWFILPFCAFAQVQDYAGEDKMICSGGTTKIGKISSCEPCCYKWSPTYGLDDPSKANPTVSGLTESLIYSVTVSLPNGNFEVDHVTVYVYTSEIDIFKPRFLYSLNAPDQMVTEDKQKIPGAQTMVNIDNDDCDGAFDREDDLVENGDDEFVKIRVQLSVDLPGFAPHGPSGAEKSPPPLQYKAKLELFGSNSNSNGVRFWRSDDKAAGEYFLGDVIDLAPAGGIIYEGFIWAEGIDGQTAAQQTKLKVRAFGDYSDCPNIDFVSLTVIGINAIEWEGNGNGYTGDGKNDSNTLDEVTVNGTPSKRVFAEGKYQNGTITSARTSVKVKVTFSTALVDFLPLYMRAFDIDDPSDDLTFVDPNDAGGSGTYAGGAGLSYTKDEDNRGKVSFSANSHFQVTDKVYGAFSGNAPTDIVECVNVPLGIFWKTLGAGTSEYIPNFTVSKYPGDNYRTAMYGDIDFLEKLRNEDQLDRQKIVDMTTGSGSSCLEIAIEYTSPVLAEYRTLHIEADRMKRADEIANENMEIRNAYINNFTFDGIGPNIKRASLVDGGLPPIPLIPNDGSTNPGRFAGGSVKIGNNAFLDNSVQGNDGTEVVFKTAPTMPRFEGLECIIKFNIFFWTRTVTSIKKIGTQFEITLDSDIAAMQSLGGANVRLGGSTWQFVTLTTIPGSNNKFLLSEIKIPIILKDDDVIDKLPYMLSGIAESYVSKAYEEANIDAVFDDGGNSAFKDELNFLINLNTGGVSGHVLEYYDLHSGAKSIEGDDYWAAYLVYGWQSEIVFDRDPSVESLDIANTSTPGANLSMHCNLSDGWNATYINIETTREFFGPTLFEQRMGWIIAHEIGHQMGLTHGFFGDNPCATCIPDCNHVGIMTKQYADDDHFFAVHLNLLRSRKKSPKM